MGNEQNNKHEQNDYFQHDRLGPVKLIEFHDTELDQVISSMILSKSVQSQSVIDLWRSQMMRIDDTQAKQILLLPTKYHFERGGMCGSSGLVNITYENLSYVLKGQIQNRFKINRFFQERQVWYLLYNMIRAGNKFQRIKKKVGNIHPNNILINDDGQIKIISTCSIPDQSDNFQLLTQNHQAEAFLAPQQLANDALLNVKYPPNVNPSLAEVFCIGLTTLSAGTLLDCQSVYQRRKDGIKINQNTLQSLLQNFRNRYSSFLSDIVTDMVALNPNNRKRSSDIYEILYQYENQILDLQPFTPPERYQIPQQSMIHPQHQMIGSQIHGSNVYSKNAQQFQSRQVMHQNPIQYGNQSIIERNIPVYVASNQSARGVNNSDSVVYTNQQQFRPAQQSGYFVQQSGIIPHQSGMIHQSGIINQNGIIPHQSGMINHQNVMIPQPSQYIQEGSKIMHGSIMPQSQFSNIHNANIAQSNYIPNYQFKR